MKKFKNLKSFTMAEILISMTIIGIVALMTLPSLLSKINARALNTQKRALFAKLSQGIAMMSGLNGYGDYTAEVTEDDNIVTAGVDTAAESFITDGLSKVLKIHSVCAASYSDNDEKVRKALKNCGLSETYKDALGNVKDFPTSYNVLNLSGMDASVVKAKTHAAAFRTVNGESVAVLYNPNAADDFYIGNYNNQFTLRKDTLSAVFIFDLNGLKGPNRFGQDIGIITAIFSTHPKLSYIEPDTNNIVAVNNSLSLFKKQCEKVNKSYKLPDLYELYSMLAVRPLIAVPSNIGSSLRRNIATSTIFYDDNNRVWAWLPLNSLFSTTPLGNDVSFLWCNNDIFKK